MSTTSEPGIQSQATPILPIVALVLALLVAPAGLVIGIVGLRKSKASGGVALILTVIAVVVGAVGTVAIAAILIVTFTAVGSANAAATKTAFCERFEADSHIASDYNTFANSYGLPHNSVPASSTAAEAVQQAKSLSSRISAIAGSATGGDGGNDIYDEWQLAVSDMTNVPNNLSVAAQQSAGNSGISTINASWMVQSNIIPTGTEAFCSGTAG